MILALFDGGIIADFGKDALNFGGFCGSMFAVVGAGFSTLDTVANPFLGICGSPRYSKMRLSLEEPFSVKILAEGNPYLLRKCRRYGNL